MSQIISTWIQTKYKNRKAKNSRINISDYTEHDYNNSKHKEIILANDCTYLSPTKDCKQYHLYFVGTIEHNYKYLDLSFSSDFVEK